VCWFLLGVGLVAAPAPGGAQGAPAAPAPPAAPAAPKQELTGRIETHAGLRLLRVWGTPPQRGYAHGFLLGADIAAVLRAEFEARFARQKPLLQQARAAFDRLIEFPDEVQQEVEALWAGLCDSGADRAMPELERDFDLRDLQVATALDVFGLMGCSGFTAYGEQVEGGGVLSGRNFDWPFTGAHLVDEVLLLVSHLPDGRAVASVTWPGYVATITGVSSEGVAVFLHVGTGAITWTPEPDSWPTGIAARVILERAAAAAGAAAFPLAQDLLANTSPPAGYITRVVLPSIPAGDEPYGVFETDRDSCRRARLGGPNIATNHFLGRADGRKASKDSLDRAAKAGERLQYCLRNGDHKLSPAEGWTLLQSVERGGKHAFGTLHSLVFRAEPWYFELRIAELRGRDLVAAPSSARVFALDRAALFQKDAPGSGHGAGR
jgi:hypothetical protein